MDELTALLDLREFFSSEVRSRGTRYASEGRVLDLQPEPSGASATVLGSEPYFVDLVVTGHGRPGSCSCPAFDRYGACKHLWAVLLELAAGHGREPVHRAPRGVQAATRQPEPSWRQWLHSMAHFGAVTAPDAWSRVPDATEEFRYQIQAERASRTDGTRVLFVKRRRRRDGSWGKPTTIDAAGLRARDVHDARDREILALVGMLHDDDGWSRTTWRHHDHSLDIGTILSRRALPMMAATGRMDLLRGSRPPVPLRWTGEGAFRIRIERSHDEAAGEIVIRTSLERGETEHSIEDVAGVLRSGFVVIEDELAPVEPAHMTTVLAGLVSHGALRVPAESEPELRTSIAALPPEIRSSFVPDPIADASAPADAPAPAPVPLLHIEPAGGRASGNRRLDCTIGFDYGGEHPIHADERVPVVAPPESDIPRRRDFDEEIRRLTEFVEHGGARPKPHPYIENDPTVAARDVPALVSALLERGWRVTADGVRMRAAGEFSLSIRSGIDWFDLEGGMRFGDEIVELPELLRAHAEGRVNVRLGDGSFGVLPADWLAQWDVLGLGEPTKEGTVRFRPNQGWLLDMMLAEREEVCGDAGFAAYRKRLARFDGIRPRKEPRGFKGELRPYQREALGWFRFLEDMGLGGCLADDMGLGKTVQVLALLEAHRARRPRGGAKGDDERRPSLVVAPRSLIFNWINEAARFAPRLTTLDYTGTDRKRRWAEAGHVDLLLTTYGTLRRDAVELAEVQFEHVVLDEATAIKNANSQAAKSARLLRARHRLALTGTPVENQVGDLWSLFEFLNPGMLGRSSAFRDLVGGEMDDERAQRLATAIRPFFLRRKKEEVLTDLPPKSEQVLTCELSRKERKRYDDLRRHFRRELLGGTRDDDLGREKIHVLEALLRLRQAACHPGLVDSALESESSAKLEVLLERLEAVIAEGHKALVFSQFTRLLGIVRERLDSRGIVHEYLDGRTRDREARVSRFMSDPDCPAFLISLKAGGHGLNLTASDYVFLLDPWWNPAVESQAVDRAHRIGQERPVFAYRLIAKDTVEERVIELQKSKRALADALFGGSRKGVLADLTRADLDALLS